MEHKKNSDCNRNVFAQMVLPAFICAYIWKSDIRTVYSKFISKLNSDKNNDHRAQNDERRKILENCLTLFTDIKMKKQIEAEREALKKQLNEFEHRGPDYEREPSHSELAKRIISAFPERLFGDNKRKYDMSHKYSSGIIAARKAPDGSTVKGVKLVPVGGIHTPSWCLQDNYGRLISIHLIGRLQYLNGFGEGGYLEQFSVEISRANSDEDEDEYIVYTNINMVEMGENFRYTDLVIKELLNKNNIELSNACGYIGEITSTKGESKKLSVGQEFDDEGGFYRYQVAPDYALMYDPEQLSAVVDYVRQQERIRQQIEKNDSTSR